MRRDEGKAPLVPGNVAPLPPGACMGLSASRPQGEPASILFERGGAPEHRQEGVTSRQDAGRQSDEELGLLVSGIGVMGALGAPVCSPPLSR